MVFELYLQLLWRDSEGPGCAGCRLQGGACPSHLRQSFGSLPRWRKMFSIKTTQWCMWQTLNRRYESLYQLCKIQGESSPWSNSENENCSDDRPHGVLLHHMSGDTVGWQSSSSPSTTTTAIALTTSSSSSRWTTRCQWRCSTWWPGRTRQSLQPISILLSSKCVKLSGFIWSFNFCSSQPSMVHWLSSSIFPCLFVHSFVRLSVPLW